MLRLSLAVLIASLALSSCATSPARSFLDRPSPDDVRVVAWNVGRNSIIPEADPDESPLRPERSARVFRALNPDVLCLNEIQVGAASAAARFDAILPLSNGEHWQAHGAFDVVILSRWPLSNLAARVLEPSGKKRAHAIALVDVPDDRGSDLYVVCAHTQSRDGEENIAFRQLQSDIIVSWMRDATTPGGEIGLPPRTPFVILGDLNVIATDPGNHLRTLITGDIANNAEFGPDAPPDWDGTSLTDAYPAQNGRGDVHWTWRDDSDDFEPNALDRILYSDSVFCVDNSFVLNTRAMSARELRHHGLQRDDVLREPKTGNYDHLPVVIDGHACDR